MKIPVKIRSYPKKIRSKFLAHSLKPATGLHHCFKPQKNPQ